MKLTQKN